MSKYITITQEVDVDISISDLDQDDIKELLNGSYGDFLEEITTRCRPYGEPLRDVVNEILRDNGHLPLPH